MPYVERKDSVVVGVYYGPVAGIAEEFLDDNNAEVETFLNPPPAPVESVSARQFKLQLLAGGMLDQVDAWVKTQDRATQIAYEYSGEFVKDSPMMAPGFASMGFTSQQIDDFFTAASKL